MPDKINYYSLDPKDSKNNSLLAEKVMKDLGIQIFVDSDEMRQEKMTDEKSILTQLSYAKVALENLPLKQEISDNNSIKTSTMSLEFTESTEESFGVETEVNKIIKETNLEVAMVLEKSWLLNQTAENEEGINELKKEAENEKNSDKKRPNIF